MSIRYYIAIIIGLLIGMLYADHVVAENLTVDEPVASKAGRCFHKLSNLYRANISDETKDQVLRLFVKYDVPTPLIAMASQESAFDPKAESTVGARGLFQITKPALRDAAKACTDLGYHPDRLYEPEYNFKAFICFTGVVREVYLDGSPSFIAFLVYYNGGFRQLNRLRTGQTVVHETANYVTGVLYRMDLCQD